MARKCISTALTLDKETTTKSRDFTSSWHNQKTVGIHWDTEHKSNHRIWDTFVFSKSQSIKRAKTKMSELESNGRIIYGKNCMTKCFRNYSRTNYDILYFKGRNQSGLVTELR